MLSTEDLRELKAKANVKDSKILSYYDMLIFISMDNDMKCKQAKKQNSEADEKVKEYGFDSLMFRYKEAREKQKQLEILQEKDKCRASGAIPKIDKIEFEYTRDFMRFREILDDIIGEHN